MAFRNRREAGRMLAERLEHLRASRPVVVGLPRGGVPVAYEVAGALHAPLDVIVVRKLGVPDQPELGMGAIGEDGERVVNEDVIRAALVTDEQLAAVTRRELKVVEARAQSLRRGRAAIPLEGRTVIVVDDGLATGGTARAAVHIARKRGASRVVLAVPVAPADSRRALEADADEVVCLETPTPFMAVGQWFRDFTPVSDDEVAALLSAAPVDAALDIGDPGDATWDAEIEVAAGRVRLPGHVTIPQGARGLVIFAHGSGSSRHSHRNRAVATRLNRAGLGTLLFDLLTEAEASDRANVFDVPLLAERLVTATDWLHAQPQAARHSIGYFGASTGAAAALWAAAENAAAIDAVVSRGGRPDLAAERLGEVRAPTLLIVGGRDDVVVELNREAARRLRCEHRIEIVPGATHLFEEPGALDAVAELAEGWFLRYLAAPLSSHQVSL